MRDQEEDIKLITRFFDLGLSEEELTAFEKRMEQDPEFKNKVQTYQDAHSIVQNKYHDKTEKSRIKKWENLLDKQEDVTSSKGISWKWIGSIAALFAIVFSVWQITSVFQEPNMDQLIAASWDKNVGLGYYTNRSDGQNMGQEKIEAAYLAYKDKKYSDVKELLQDFKDGEAYFEDAVLLSALANHKVGDSKKALNLLNTLNKDKTSTIAKTAQWYKGLIYLEMGDELSAKKFLELPNDATSEIKLKELP